MPWSVHTSKKKEPVTAPNQLSLEDITAPDTDRAVGQGQASQEQKEIHPQAEPTVMAPVTTKPSPVEIPDLPVQSGEQMKLNLDEIDREAITKFINDQGLLTYMVRNVKINNYLKSLLDLAGLLTQTNIYTEANDEVEKDVVAMIRAYIDELHAGGTYDALAGQVLSFKLSVCIFDVFGKALDNGRAQDFITASESDLDRQLRAADARLGAYGFPYKYGRVYADLDDLSEYKIDCILFAADDDCVGRLNRYAEDEFHALNDQYRKYVANKSERCKKQYSDIIADGDVVSKHNFTLPEMISARLEDGGKEYDNHLFADENGIARIKLNGWEEGVLAEEVEAPDFVCWLRNPSRGVWSLCIPYEINGETKPMYPDFIIVRRDPILGYVLDILEPHGKQYADNLAKAKGMAKYAEAEPRIGRIQMIRQGKDAAGKNRFRRLDLSKGAVRDKVLKAQTSDEMDHIFERDGFFGG